MVTDVSFSRRLQVQESRDACADLVHHTAENYNADADIADDSLCEYAHRCWMRQRVTIIQMQ